MILLALHYGEFVMTIQAVLCSDLQNPRSLSRPPVPGNTALDKAERRIGMPEAIRASTTARRTHEQSRIGQQTLHGRFFALDGRMPVFAMMSTKL